jgi:hypothetical protein
VAAEQQRRAIGWYGAVWPIDAPGELSANRLEPMGIFGFPELALILWIGLHALPIALASK